jgi:anaerobic magnesium-protoporphyrin IX monomethyl ester cyclase
MMKSVRPHVLLLNPPAPDWVIRDYYCSFPSKAKYYWPPQDLLGLSGLLADSCRLTVLDAVMTPKSGDEIRMIIEEEEIDTVIFTTGSASLAGDMALAEFLAGSRPSLRLIASAGILKFFPERFMERFPFLRAAFLDFTEPEIVDFVAGKEADWNTVWERRSGRLRKPAGIFGKTFKLGVPRHELFPFRLYSMPTARYHPLTVVTTSLGCPYKCRFCTAGAYGLKYRDLDDAMAEFRHVKELGIRELWFVDPTLTVNGKFLGELLHRMIDAGFGFSFACNADINSMNEEKIKLLKAAGCHTVSIGLESGDDGILKRYRKTLDTRKSRAIVKLFKRHGIRTLGYFIIGLPGEGRPEIRRTIDFAKSLDIDFASFAIATPDIGTDLRREALENGWMRGDVDTFDSTLNPVMEAGDLPLAEIVKLRNRAEIEFYLRPSYILKKLFSLQSRRDLAILAGNGFHLLRKMFKRN